ncbi:hypothetical protein ACF0H5_002742 [Mactra antiquata]
MADKTNERTISNSKQHLARRISLDFLRQKAESIVYGIQVVLGRKQIAKRQYMDTNFRSTFAKKHIRILSVRRLMNTKNVAVRKLEVNGRLKDLLNKCFEHHILEGRSVLGTIWLKHKDV